jgi:FkbM family methyltransferase
LVRWEYISKHKSIGYVDVRIQPNLSMRLFFDSPLSKEIYTGHFEWRERLFLNAFLQPGDIFVDVGANIGLFTLIAAQCVSPAGRVFSFEPNPSTFQRLSENVRMSNFANVSLYQSALSDQIALFNLVVESDDSLGTLAYSENKQVYSDQLNNCKIIEVNTITWDDFAQKHNLVGKVTLMKIDVEGWEAHVLDGAVEMLARPDAPVLHIEFNDKAAQLAGWSCLELYTTLQRLGYQIFRYDDLFHQIKIEQQREYYTYANLIATKRPEQVEARLKQRKQLWRIR